MKKQLMSLLSALVVFILGGVAIQCACCPKEQLHCFLCWLAVSVNAKLLTLFKIFHLGMNLRPWFLDAASEKHVRAHMFAYLPLRFRCGG